MKCWRQHLTSVSPLIPSTNKRKYRREFKTGVLVICKGIIICLLFIIELNRINIELSQAQSQFYCLQFSCQSLNWTWFINDELYSVIELNPINTDLSCFTEECGLVLYWWSWHHWFWSDTNWPCLILWSCFEMFPTTRNYLKLAFIKLVHSLPCE